MWEMRRALGLGKIPSFPLRSGTEKIPGYPHPSGEVLGEDMKHDLYFLALPINSRNSVRNMKKSTEISMFQRSKAFL